MEISGWLSSWPKCFTPRERIPGTHSVSRLGSRASLDTAMGRKKLLLLEIELLGTQSISIHYTDSATPLKIYICTYGSGASSCVLLDFVCP
jgi:hypothetical protein